MTKPKIKSKVAVKKTRVTKKIVRKAKVSALKKKTVLSKKIKVQPKIVPEYIPIQKPHLKKSVNVDDTTLPELNEESRLRLMARDPNWVHAYWHVSPEDEKEAKKNLGHKYEKSQKVLRMHDVTNVKFNGKNANRSFDIDVHPEAKNWYVDMWHDNVSYCAQFGLRTDEGEFYPLTDSNFVHTARSSYSDRSELIWMEVTPEACKKPFVMTGKSGKGRGKYRWYLTEDDIRAYYANLFPLLRRILARRLRIFRKKFGSVELDDDYLFNLHKSRWSRKILLGASEEMFEIGELGGSESITSRGGSEREVKKRQFFFELGTELIVYGRTEPNAEVWHGDKKIALRPDGTFSMRLAFPDQGFIPLDFKAVSHDKLEVRTIFTSAKRAKTKYSTENF